MAKTQFTINELLDLDKLLGRVADIKGTESVAVALLFTKIKTIHDELVAEEAEAKKAENIKPADTATETKAPKKK